ncbi:MAG: glycoside hydrolase family 16 protein [Treponema sp.]|nr:glycoside hydrolase family 16 protein [Treponema sp.]
MTKIHNFEVFAIDTPVAGNYPQGFYKYPFKKDVQTLELFSQTLVWLPGAPRTFAGDTQYTAVLTLEPADDCSFEGTTIDDISGLPADAENITISADEKNLVIKIIFKKTAEKNAPARIIFSDDFKGNGGALSSIDRTKWDFCPEMDRQGRSSWRDDMVSVKDGLLRLKFARDPELGKEKSKDAAFAKNWIRAGAVRTRTKDDRMIFFHGFGFYEARIKFPVVSGTWGAFWLMSPTQRFITEDGINGAEIDIIETIKSHLGGFNSALHWNGYSDKHQFVSSGRNRTADNPRPDINIFDGEFHTFALDWSPSCYLFYIDSQLFWRVDGGDFFNNCGINQNPNYIKLTTEGAVYSGDLPEDFSEDEMLVDYVKVYNQPQL